MNKLGVRDGQEQPTSIFWVSEEKGKALKHLAVDFPALWQKRGRMYGVQTTQHLSFQNMPLYPKDLSYQYSDLCLT